LSKISNIFDSLEAFVTTTLPDHKEMSNPYFPESESDLRYEKAYGIAYADGTNLEQLSGGIATLQRDFIVSVVRKIFYVKDSREIRKQTEKDLFEDQFLLIQGLEQDPTIADNTNITRAVFVQDGGIEFVRVERNDILILRNVVRLEYHENVAC
jgi:hypothetical protein